jgi:hypothetical protein
LDPKLGAEWFPPVAGMLLVFDAVSVEDYRAAVGAPHPLRRDAPLFYFAAPLRGGRLIFHFTAMAQSIDAIFATMAAIIATIYFCCHSRHHKLYLTEDSYML